MSVNNSVQEFKDKNSVYQLLYNYIVRTRIDFLGTSVSDLSKNVVKRFIEKDGKTCSKEHWRCSCWGGYCEAESNP